MRLVLLVVAPLAACDAILAIGDPQTEILVPTVGQTHDGEIDINSLTDRMPDLARANLIETLDARGYEPEGKLFARPPIADDIPPQTTEGKAFAVPSRPDEYLERWVFADADAIDDMTRRGFALTWVGIHPATCEELTAQLPPETVWPASLFSEQFLVYTPPPETVAGLRSADMTTYRVYQPDASDTLQMRGRMLRLRTSSDAGATYQDHWLLDEAYEPLGFELAQLTLVIFDGEEWPTVQAWVDAYGTSEQDYTTATYTLDSVSACSDAPTAE